MRILPVPVRRRKFAFMLTPLVDIMFLMLIFFMVSSQTSPYSLLTMQAAHASPAAPGQASLQSADTSVPQVRVTVYDGYVRYNGVRVEFASLRAAVDQSRAVGAVSAVVLASPAATVQDVVSVVEVFSSAEFGDLQLVTQEGASQ